MVVLLGRDYPKKIWTKFESERFKERFGQKTVIPVWFSDAPPGMFDETTKVGGITFEIGRAKDHEVQRVSDILCKKLIEYKESVKSLETEP